MLHSMNQIAERTIHKIKKSFENIEEKLRSKAEHSEWRRFWIYFIISLFFIIIGLTLSLNEVKYLDSNTPIATVTIWIISSLLLFILVFQLSEKSKFYSEKRKIIEWSIINGIYVLYLILSIIWISELHNRSSSMLRTIMGVLIILGGLVLLRVSLNDGDRILRQDVILIFLFCVLWFVLSFVSIVNYS